MSSTHSGEIPVNGTSFVEDIIDNALGYATGPERALMSALLFDGVQAYMSYAVADDERIRSRYKEAYNWVHRHKSEYIFSFNNVCEALGIDPEFLRFGLANACNSQSFEWKRSRRNF